MKPTLLPGDYVLSTSLFRNIVKRATYHVNCPAAEGMATSILLTNTFGVIPVVSASSGIDIENFGYEINNEKNSIINKFNELKNVSEEKTSIRIISTLKHSEKFSLSLFKKNLSASIYDLLHQK